MAVGVGKEKGRSFLAAFWCWTCTEQVSHLEINGAINVELIH
jgi:hypothetical protein